MGLYEELFAPDLSLMESTSKLEGLLEYYYAAKDSGEYTTDILYQIKEATEEVSNKKKINALKKIKMAMETRKSAQKVVAKYKDKALASDCNGVKVKVIRYEDDQTTAAYAKFYKNLANKIEAALTKLNSDNKTKEDKEQLKSLLSKAATDEKVFVNKMKEKLGHKVNEKQYITLNKSIVKKAIKTLETEDPRLAKLRTEFKKANDDVAYRGSTSLGITTVERAKNVIANCRWAAAQIELTQINANTKNAKAIVIAAANCGSSKTVKESFDGYEEYFGDVFEENVNYYEDDIYIDESFDFDDYDLF